MIYIELLDSIEIEEVVFDEVLLKAEGGSKGQDSVLVVGNPFIEGASVKGKVLEQARGKKVKILKFRRRKHSMKKMGHRQPYSEIEIESISLNVRKQGIKREVENLQKEELEMLAPYLLTLKSLIKF